MSDNPSAFPTHDQTQTTDPRERILQGGMTLRDWFAGQIISAVIAAASSGNHTLKRKVGLSLERAMAEDAYTVADAMLAARTGDA